MPVGDEANREAYCERLDGNGACRMRVGEGFSLETPLGTNQVENSSLHKYPCTSDSETNGHEGLNISIPLHRTTTSYYINIKTSVQQSEFCLSYPYVFPNLNLVYL